jgi:hypothetical protein
MNRHAADLLNLEKVWRTPEKVLAAFLTGKKAGKFPIRYIN